MGGVPLNPPDPQFIGMKMMRFQPGPPPPGSLQPPTPGPVLPPAPPALLHARAQPQTAVLVDCQRSSTSPPIMSGNGFVMGGCGARYEGPPLAGAGAPQQVQQAAGGGIQFLQTAVIPQSAGGPATGTGEEGAVLQQQAPAATTTTTTTQLAEVYWHYNPGPEMFSRKVFVGGLPIDVDEDELVVVFGRFGKVVIDWPRKNQSTSFYPPKVGFPGYAFLIYEQELAVHYLLDTCYKEEDKYYICVSSPTMKEKPVQVRPWRLADADFVVDTNVPLDPRKSVFLTGMPRPMKAVELAHLMDRVFGGVCYAGIDTDPCLKYPKGSGRVAFNNRNSYVAAVAAQYAHLRMHDMDKRAEVKPYVLEEQACDVCRGGACGGRSAPYFCPNVACLLYLCEVCWGELHARPGFEYHKATVKDLWDRKRRFP